MQNEVGAGISEAYAPSVLTEKGNGPLDGSKPAPGVTVLIYANELPGERDAFDDIARGYSGQVERRFVVESTSVREEDVDYVRVFNRVRTILDDVGEDAETRVVLAGYSPLVAVLSHVARNLDLKQVYYVRHRGVTGFVEVFLNPE